MEQAFWEKRNVKILKVELEEYIELLERRPRRAARRRVRRVTATAVTGRPPVREDGAADLAVSRPQALHGVGLRLLLRTRSGGEIVSANLLGARLTLLYGPSGVGKSSVLLAGVVSHLRERSRRTSRTTTRPASRGRCARLGGSRSAAGGRRRGARGGQGTARTRRSPRPALRRDARGGARPLERTGSRKAARAVRPVRGVLPLPRPRRGSAPSTPSFRKRSTAPSCGPTSSSRFGTTRSHASTASRAGSRICSRTGCRSTT